MAPFFPTATSKAEWRGHGNYILSYKILFILCGLSVMAVSLTQLCHLPVILCLRQSGVKGGQHGQAKKERGKPYS